MLGSCWTAVDPKPAMFFSRRAVG